MREKEAETTAENGAEVKKFGVLKDTERSGRNFMLGSMAGAGILECVLSGILSHQKTDRMVILVLFGILYSVVFFAGMELYRLQKDWFYEKAANYRSIARWYWIFCGAGVLFGFLPEFARPVLLLSLGMTVVTSNFFGLAAGIFHAAVFCLCGQANVHVLLCDIFLLIAGCMAASVLQDIKEQSHEIVFLFLYTFGSVLIFSFARTGQLEWDVLIYGVCNGIFSSVGAGILYRKVYSYPQNSRKQELERIVRDDFGLVQEVQKFSKMDYNHAIKVSIISENCAKIAGADPDLAAAAGFYYRLGRMAGEPYVENGVALAKSNRLPMEVIEILREYNGEQALPSTLESAIVHIVDSVVAKFDVLDKTTLSSSWNQDILVYQTLNENSASGLYDKSGFSMNMFLKIRDYLIKEANLF
ncbi:hypothetical protein [Eubacterium sp. 14-2]|uniref:hypothetical protein n=1 Tax=Eubacterium sp. 14-2 TaxID=1235790 RepID=UPI0003B2E71F|nr:hypothetical protein [Eubacterium sp. 14-2]